jgi:hypothetical protein
LTGFVIGVLIVGAFVGAAVIVGIRQGRANVRQGVIAAWEGRCGRLGPKDTVVSNSLSAYCPEYSYLADSSEF